MNPAQNQQQPFQPPQLPLSPQPPDQLPTPPRKTQKILIIAGVTLCIILLVVVAVVVILLQKKQSKQDALKGQESTEQEPIVSDAAVLDMTEPGSGTETALSSGELFPDEYADAPIVFIERHVASESGSIQDTVVLYDHDLQSRIFEKSFSNESNVLISPLSWSPDGKVLGLMLVETDQTAGTDANIVLYNQDTGEFSSAIAIGTYLIRMFQHESPGYVGWYDANRMLLGPFAGEDLASDSYSVIHKLATEAAQISRSEIMPITRRASNAILALDTSGALFGIQIAQGTFSYTPEGTAAASILGVTGSNDRLLVLRGDVNHASTEDQASNGVQVRSDLESTHITYTAPPVYTNAVVEVIPLGKNKPESTITLPNNEWFVLDVQMLPEGDEIVVHEINNIAIPTSERFTRYALNSGRPKLIATRPINSGDRPYDLAYIATGHTFFITSDESWIVQYTGKLSSQSTRSIVMWNMQTKEEVLLCENVCAGLTLFNPFTMPDSQL